MTTPVDVKLVTEQELPAIVAALGQERFFRDRLLRQELGNGELFVAWAGDTAVGDVYLWRERPSEPAVAQHLGWTPTIQHLEVAARWRNRGIGTALLHAAQEYAAELGYARVCLAAGVTNLAARRIYERLGYGDWGHGLVDVVGEETGSDGTLVRAGETCHWLVRPLPTGAPGVDDWAAWQPAEVYQRFRSSPVDWYVAGGWAVDLWLGGQTRPHDEIEVAIDRTDFATWRAGLAQFALYDVGHGRLRSLGEGDDPDPRHHQVWLCDQADRVWRMATVLQEQVPGWWTCHWLPLVRHPSSLAVTRTASGIPFLRPELVLLGKAQYRRPKDEADLRAVLPTLDDDARARLRTGLRTADETHPWLATVGPPAPRSA